MSKDFVTVTTHRRAFPKRKFADGDVPASEPKRFEYGGVNDDDDDSWEAERQKELYGFSPSSVVMRGIRTAEGAAPRAFSLPSATPSTGSASREVEEPETPPAPSVTPIPTSATKVDPVVAPVPAAAKPSANVPGSNTRTSNSPRSPYAIDWRKVAARGLAEGRSANPVSALAGIGGAALAAYLNKRRQSRKGEMTGDAIDSAAEGVVAAPRALLDRRGTANRRAEPDYNAEADYTPDFEELVDLPQRSSALDEYMIPKFEYAEGGKVSPSDSNRSMRGRRPMGRSAGPPAYVPPPGSAPTFPGGVGQITPPGGGPGGLSPGMGRAVGPPPGGPSPGIGRAVGPPPGGPSAMGGMSPGGPPPGGPGIDPSMMARILADRAQAQGAVPTNVSMGGPPPGVNAMGPMGGLPPGAMLPGGPPSGPMPMGGPPSGPPPGMMPRGGPPSGPPPGAMPGMGGPPSGPPPGMMPQGGPPSGPPPGVMPGMGGPPSGPPPGAMPGMGGPPSGPPRGAMPGGPPQNSWTPEQMQPVGNAASPWARANFPGNPNNPSWASGGPPPGGPPPGGQLGPAMAQQQAAARLEQSGGTPSNRAASPEEMQTFLARKQAMGMAKGGAVEDTEGFGPRAKKQRVRQFGDVGKAAEDLPPEAHKKGGKVKHRRPTSKKKLSVGEKLPVPMVTDDDMGIAPVPPAAAQAGLAPMPAGPPPPPAAPPPALPPGMAKGGECAKMAEGGVAKLRRGFPNTKGTKKMAKGGSVRGCGAATKGKNFSGIY